MEKRSLKLKVEQQEIVMAPSDVSTTTPEENKIVPELSALVDILRIEELQPSKVQFSNNYRIFAWVDVGMSNKVFADVALLSDYRDLILRDLIPIDLRAPELFLNVKICKWRSEEQIGPTRGITLFGKTRIPLPHGPGRVIDRYELVMEGESEPRTVGHVSVAIEIGVKGIMELKCHSSYSIVEPS